MNLPNKPDEARFKAAYRLATKHYITETLRLWKLSVPGLLLPAIGSIFVFYIPAIFLSEIVKRGTSDGGTTLLNVLPLIGLFAGSWFLGEMMWRLGMHFAIKFQVRGVENLYRVGLARLLDHDLRFFHDNFAGSLTKRTLAYANRYVDVLDTMLFNVFANIIPVIFAAIVLATYSGWLSLLLIGTLTVSTLIVLPLIKKRRVLVTERETASTVSSGHIADVYGNIDAVRAHASEKREQARHMFFVRDLTKKMAASWNFQNKKIDMVISPIYVAINASGLILSVYLAQKGQIDYAAVIVVYTFFARVTNFMWEFNGIYRRLETSLSDAAQYTELILDQPTINDPANPVEIDKPKGSLAFNKVTFAYEDNGKTLFKDFDLHIKSGEKIGLVGRSGGGKTSITKLLLRFVDINKGSLQIDGVDIRDMSQEYLRSLISYVPQDPAMFHRTIAENIAYGKPDADHDEIVAAAKKAHAHEFIKDLPDGYETLVGERGIKLSGGQRQRVAIARAMLKNAPILLLDEATSALDSESEKLIQDALWKLMDKKTAIVIAHRLSTIQKMDRIIVLDKGQIAEQGTHPQLVKRKKGIYSQLWSHQSGGFIED